MSIGSLVEASLEMARLYERARLFPVPKRSGVRWLTLLDDATAAAYRARVARVAPRIEAGLSARVIANRVRRPTAGTPADVLRLEPWSSARRRFSREARARSAGRGALLLADVRNCYASIDAAVVEERLLRLECDPSEVGEVVRLLEELAAEGVPGLPIGPVASALLANAVLDVADRALAVAGAEHLRWVDDFVVFARDADHAAQVLDGLRASLAGIGLALSETKTRVIDDLGLSPERAPSLDLSDVLPRI